MKRVNFILDEGSIEILKQHKQYGRPYSFTVRTALKRLGTSKQVRQPAPIDAYGDQLIDKAISVG